MKLRLLLFVTFAISINNLVHAQEQTFKLKDGTVIIGKVQEETDLTMQVETKFGIVTISKSELILTQYQVILNSGETFLGIKTEETIESIILKTNMGVLTIQKSDIVNIQELSKQKSSDKNNSLVTNTQSAAISYPRRSNNLLDFLFSGMKMDKDTDFSLGEEQLTDLFFDPTGYTFQQSTLYLSGLSFGFGVSDRFQITTKWWGFFDGNLNLRPKFQLFEKGNWENQQSLSIGAHYHSRWKPNKYEWKSISVPNDNNDEVKYLGSYFKIGENPEFKIKGDSDNEYINRIDEWEDVYIEMIELFGAYTFSKSRSNLKGRISHTIGGNIQYAMLDDPIVMPRVYYGLDVDINQKIKMIGEIFYDPYFLEAWQMSEYEDNYPDVDQLDNNIVAEPTDSRSLHLDFGFMYALNESFRFGLHFQQPFVAFYWKF